MDIHVESLRHLQVSLSKPLSSSLLQEVEMTYSLLEENETCFVYAGCKMNIETFHIHIIYEFSVNPKDELDAESIFTCGLETVRLANLIIESVFVKLHPKPTIQTPQFENQLEYIRSVLHAHKN